MIIEGLVKMVASSIVMNLNRIWSLQYFYISIRLCNNTALEWLCTYRSTFLSKKISPSYTYTNEVSIYEKPYQIQIPLSIENSNLMTSFFSLSNHTISKEALLLFQETLTDLQK